MLASILLLFASALPIPILHLRADQGVVLDAKGRVETWKDRSPRHSDFGSSQLGRPQLVFLTSFHDTAEKRVFKTLDSDAKLRPRYVRVGIGGKPSIAFDGAQALVNESSLPLDSGFSLFVVAQNLSPNGQCATMIDKGPGDFNTDLPNGHAGGVNGSFNMGIAWVYDVAHSDFTTTQPTLYESAWNGKTGSLWVNGHFLTSGNYNARLGRNPTTWMGGVLNPHGVLQNFLVGRISEVLVYPGELSVRDRQMVELLLMAKYKISATSPERR
ncbi:MAG: hypothetical protein IPO40_12125 [Fibrobacteres bacterium]|nr:hypothetical protein [Fibrobacterota bacterium]